MELEELNFEKILQKASKSGNPGVVVKGVTSTWHQVCSFDDNCCSGPRETKNHEKFAVIFIEIISNILPILESQQFTQSTKEV